MAEHIDVTTLTQDRLNELRRQLHESSEEIAALTVERTSLQNDVARAQQAQSQAPGTPGQPAPQASQHGSVGQPASAASYGVVCHDGDDDHGTTHPEATNAARSQPRVTISAPTNDSTMPTPMPLKPQRLPCFDPSQRDRVRIRCGGNFTFRQEMLATTLDGTDILLSHDWLRRHNPQVDWTTGDCTVQVNGNNIALPRWGSPESSSVRVNAITMKRAVAAGVDVYAVDIWEAEVADKGGDLQKLLADVPDDLAAQMKQYSGIFPDDLPTRLPPQRPHDHRIELEPGAQPTIQRHFRLTQPERDELRKQLDYLLEKEFIRPSSSPFAAPILFTPKKDEGFHMCIDYRALNRVTIKSRYPIPRVDKLIDQLRTAQLVTDVSDIAVGAVLLQDFGNGLQPIAYESRKLHPPERNYPIHDREMLAIVHALKVWRCYLSGADVTGVYYVKSGTNRIWVPAYSLLRELLLQEAHDGITSGHFGVEKTRQQLQWYYYWLKLLTDVQHPVGSCPTCQVMKSSRKRKAGQLQPIPLPERARQQITMDFVTGLPSNPGGNDAVMVVVDRLTKMAHFAACKKSISAEETARLFIATVVHQQLLKEPLGVVRD
ncbi:unnamed protein product [Closterium sp. NIES-54]